MSVKDILERKFGVQREYHCLWCDHRFYSYACYKKGEADPISNKSKGKKSSISNQIKCPKCGIFIPTWKKVKIGNEHIHPGRK
jgi:hypothetical protein